MKKLKYPICTLVVFLVIVLTVYQYQIVNAADLYYDGDIVSIVYIDELINTDTNDGLVILKVDEEKGLPLTNIILKIGDLEYQTVSMIWNDQEYKLSFQNNELVSYKLANGVIPIQTEESEKEMLSNLLNEYKKQAPAAIERYNEWRINSNLDV